jgi:PAS domain S-box-containing protein
MSIYTYTFLVVEDGGVDRDLARAALLASSGTDRLLTAGSAAAALELCRTHNIDGILLDYALPDVDGLELVERLVLQGNGSSPPVMLTIGPDDDQISRRAIRMGVGNYLARGDLKPQLLQSIVCSAIENTKLRQQLRQSEDRWRLSLDAVRECVGIFSTIRDESGQIVDFRFDYLNGAALANNRMRGEDLGKSCSEVFPAFCSSGLFAQYVELVETGRPLTIQNFVYEDVFDGEQLTRVYSIQATKLADGLVSCWRDEAVRDTAEIQSQVVAKQKVVEIWESITDAYITLDRDWRLIYANQAATRILYQLGHLTPADFLGKSHWELFPSLLGSDIEREYRRALTERVAVHLEIWYEPTGSWFEGHLYPIPEGLSIYFQDITERKYKEAILQQAEATIRQQLDEIETIYRNAPIGLGCVDTDLRYVRINRQLAQINGLPVAAHIGQTVGEILPELADRVEPLYRQVLESGEAIIDLEIGGSNQAEPGVERYWLASFYPQTDAEDRVIGVNNVVQEITDRKRLEAERSAAEQERDRFFNLSIDLLVTLNFDGYITRLNPAWERTLGFTEAELMARPFSEFVHPDDRATTIATAQQAISGIAIPSFENRYLCKDGTYRWLLWSAISYPAQNVMYGIAHDITERKLLETARSNAEQERDRFFNMSLDLLSIANLEGYFLRLNPAWSEILGFTTTELMARPFIEFVHLDDRASTLAATQELSAGEFVFKFENRYLCKDGSYRWLSWSCTPYLEQNLVYSIAHDVTEERRSQAALQASERKLSAIFNQTFGLIALLDVDGIVVDVNQTSLAAVQVQAADVIRCEFWDTPWWERSPRVQRIIKAAIERGARGEFSRFQIQLPTPLGTTVDIDFSLKPILDEAGRVVLTLAEGRDITELKQAERTLLESQRKFGAIFEQSFQLMAMVSLEGTVLEINQTALESLADPIPGTIAARRADIAGKPFWETPWWHTPQLQQQLKQAIDRASHGELVRFEMQFPNPSGVMVSADFSLKPIFDEARQVVMLVAEAHDITNLKRAEGDLREAQERLQTGIQVAGVGLARFDYTTNLVALSPEAAMLYGFAADTSVVTRARIHETFHPDDRVKLEVKIAQLLDPAGTGWFAEDHQVVWPCGEVRYLSVRKQIFFEHAGEVARPSYTILAAVDITERKQIQAALEARNQELDSFVYIVSHDLKAPLRAIANLSQWIEEDLAGSLPVANQQQMQLLRDRVYRMEATIDGLLDYARIGRTAGTLESVAVAQLLTETIEWLSPPPTFQIAIAQNLPTIHTNRLLLSQVFANLIGNAIKHHDRVDGSLHLGIAERGEFYEFAIADDGPGIPLEQHERVFGIFQAVNPQKRPDSTGIGLAIVKKIIEAEGGTIRLESKLGQGTTFYFTWPKRSIVPSTSRSS